VSGENIRLDHAVFPEKIKNISSKVTFGIRFALLADDKRAFGKCESVVRFIRLVLFLATPRVT